MVKSPQHTVQIMETRARFDLKAALEDWRKQLEMQPGLTPDNRRELETHLRDSVTALQQRGLTEEESIILASRRVGQPQILAEEFAKLDPAAVWRERLFWMIIGICVVRMWSGFPGYLLDIVRLSITRLFVSNFHVPDWILFYMPFRPQSLTQYVVGNQSIAILFRFVPLICLLMLLAAGRLGRAVSALRFLFESRSRFLLTAAASLAIYYGWAVAAAIATVGNVTPAPGIPSLGFAIQVAMANAVISGLLVGLLAWLMPVGRATIDAA
jgi:hypothetical protein